MPLFNLLLVDDSLNMLKSLKRTFKDENYTVFTAENAVEAMKVLESEKVDLVISDYSMPDISGIEFLKRVRVRYPDVIRIMLTGVTDFQVAKDAINQGEIYRYFNKPYDDFEIKLSVKYALIQRTLELENEALRSELHTKKKILMKLEQRFPGISTKNTEQDGSIVIGDKS